MEWLKDANVWVVCLVCTVPFLVVFVLHPWWKISRTPRPTIGEWNDIAGKIGKLTADDIEDNRWSEKSKAALKLVLRTEPGAGRLSNVPLALDILQAPFDHADGEYRALSSQSIVLGLFGTVITFALLFLSGINSVEVKSLLAKLSTVYVVNAVALTLGAIFFNKHRRIRGEGEKVLWLAQSALARLKDATDSNLAPEIAAALDRSATQFQAYSRQLFDDHFRSIGSLLGEVRGVGETLRSLVNQMLEQAGHERESIRATVRENAASLERLTGRLDEGFKLLAQPFLQGIPAIDALAKNALVFEQGARSAFTQLSEASAQLRSSAERLEQTAALLPGQTERLLSEAGHKLATEAGAAVGQAVATHFAPQVERYTAAAATAAQSMERNTDSLACVVRLAYTQVAEAAGQLQGAANRVASVADGLPGQTERLLADAGQRLAGEAGAAVGQAITSHLGPQVEQLATSVDTATQSLGSSAAAMVGVAREVSEARVAQAAVDLRGAVRELEEIIRRLPEQTEHVYARVPDRIVQAAGQAVGDQLGKALLPCVESLSRSAETFEQELTRHGMGWWSAFEALKKEGAESGAGLRRDVAELSRRVEGGFQQAGITSEAMVARIDAAVQRWPGSEHAGSR